MSKKDELSLIIPQKKGPLVMLREIDKLSVSNNSEGSPENNNTLTSYSPGFSAVIESMTSSPESSPESSPGTSVKTVSTLHEKTILDFQGICSTAVSATTHSAASTPLITPKNLSILGGQILSSPESSLENSPESTYYNNSYIYSLKLVEYNTSSIEASGRLVKSPGMKNLHKPSTFLLGSPGIQGGLYLCFPLSSFIVALDESIQESAMKPDTLMSVLSMVKAKFKIEGDMDKSKLSTYRQYIYNKLALTAASDEQESEQDYYIMIQAVRTEPKSLVNLSTYTITFRPKDQLESIFDSRSTKTLIEKIFLNLAITTEISADSSCIKLITKHQASITEIFDSALGYCKQKDPENFEPILRTIIEYSGFQKLPFREETVELFSDMLEF